MQNNTEKLLRECIKLLIEENDIWSSPEESDASGFETLEDREYDKLVGDFPTYDEDEGDLAPHLEDPSDEFGPVPPQEEGYPIMPDPFDRFWQPI